MTGAAATSADAIVVGGGISGMSAAAAFAARDGRQRVRILDRGQRLGGRMAARTLRSGPWAGHVIDVGAAYFTVDDPGFASIVNHWDSRGLALPWTDTFAVAGPDGITATTRGPLRWTAGPGGLRGLVEDLARDLPPSVVIEHPVEVSGIVSQTGHWRVASDVGEYESAVAALCMPPPQAVPLIEKDPLPEVAALTRIASDYLYEPILALVAQWPRRSWDEFDACFVNGDETLSFIADDGSRRADGAAILVAHSTPTFAARFLTEPWLAATELTAALRRIMPLPAPSDVEVKRWRLARAIGESTTDSCLVDRTHTLGIASDAFDPRPRIEAAWLSGRQLGTLLGSVRPNP